MMLIRSIALPKLIWLDAAINILRDPVFLLTKIPSVKCGCYKALIYTVKKTRYKEANWLSQGRRRGLLVMTGLLVSRALVFSTTLYFSSPEMTRTSLWCSYKSLPLNLNPMLLGSKKHQSVSIPQMVLALTAEWISLSTALGVR